MIVQFNVRDFLDRAEVAYPDRVGLIDEPHQPAEPWAPLTFAEMADRARAQAAGLDRLGIEPGERVAIDLPQRLAPAHLVLRGLRLGSHPGAHQLPPGPGRGRRTSSSTPAPRCSWSTRSSRPTCPASGPATGSCSAPTATRPSSRPTPNPRPWAADERATATINYTSGTTARPKGVQLTHRNCWVNASVFGWHIQLSDQDVYLHTLPMFHANGWGMPWSTTAVGCTQVVLRKVDGTEILRRVERHGVTLLCAAPAVVNAVLDALPDWDRPIPGRDRTRIVVAGAPPPSRTIERVESELGWEFIQIYGLTETSPLLTVNRHRSEWDELSVRGPGPQADAGRDPGGGDRRSGGCRAASCWSGATR